MSVEFKLFGEMTLRQFIYVGGAGLLSWIVWLTPLPGFIVYPIISLLIILGLFTAFVPINEIPFDEWLTNYIIAVIRPTKRIWKQSSFSPQFAEDKDLITTFKSSINSNDDFNNVAKPSPNITVTDIEAGSVDQLEKAKLEAIEYAKRMIDQNGDKPITTAPISLPTNNNVVPPKTVSTTSSYPSNSYSTMLNTAPNIHPGVAPQGNLTPPSNNIVQNASQPDWHIDNSLSSSDNPSTINKSESNESSTAPVLTQSAPNIEISSVNSNYPISTPNVPNLPHLATPHLVRQALMGDNDIMPNVNNQQNNSNENNNVNNDVDKLQIESLSSSFNTTSPADNTVTNGQIQNNNPLAAAQPSSDAVTQSSSSLENSSFVSPTSNPNMQSADMSAMLEKLQEENQKLMSQINNLKQQMGAVDSDNSSQKSSDSPLSKYAPFPTDIINQTNIISGIVVGKDEKVISDVVIIVKDNMFKPVRAVHTNILGQFFTRSPLPNGVYKLELHKEDLLFKRIEVTLEGKNVQPMLIKAVSKEDMLTLTEGVPFTVFNSNPNENPGL